MTSQPLRAALKELIVMLNRQHVRFAVVGGLAVSARIQPRFTQDIDLAVAAASDAEAETLIHGLCRQGFQIQAQVEQTATNRLATIRLRRASDPQALIVDLLFASCGIEAEIVALAEPLKIFPGLIAPVARVGHLVAMKLLSRDPRTRPQDEMDLSALLGVMTPDEAALVRESLKLITQRGYHRHRRLLSAWKRLQDQQTK